jgi:Fic family protein
MQMREEDSMRSFDFSFLEHGMLPAELLNLTTEIYALKTANAQRLNKYETVFSELEALARVQSVKGSNAIEGIITSDERIAQIVNQSSAPLNHDEAEIAGYRDALGLIHDNHQNLDFNRRDILDLHQVMLSYAGSAFGGTFKTDDNVIMEIDATGRRRVRFQPTPASETADAMEQLELAYLDARDNPRVNQLLLIPCVILDFLCIHPFRDGNGRMSRLLSLLLLYKNGFDAGKYISFEEQINNTKNQYYEALKQSSEGWHSKENTYIPFIKNFLSTLYLCYKELDYRFAVVGDRKFTKTARVEAVVENSLAPISKAEICRILPDISPSTVEAVLGRMVKDQRITRLGMGPSTRYIRNK